MKKLSHTLMISVVVLFFMLATNTLTAQVTFTLTENNQGITTSNGQFGCAWGDYDGDGDLDLLITGQGNSHVLYQNDGGQFVDISDAAGLAEVSVSAQGTVWADFDNDGDLDFMTGQSGVHLYKNDGGVFTDISAEANLSDIEATHTIWQITAADYDKDGDLDVALAGGNQEASGLAGPTRILQNNNMIFTDVKDAVIGFDLILESWNPHWADIDNDGDLDLWMPTIRTPNEPCALLINDQGIELLFSNPSETGITAKSAITSSWGDFDNDGDMDLFLIPYSGDADGNAKLYRNDGGTFVNIVAGTTLDSAFTDSRGVNWGDFDNDGDLDLLIGRRVGPQNLYRNDGGTFLEIGAESGVAVTLDDCRNVLFVDYDNDGFLDIFLASKEKKLFHNEGNSNHWIGIRLKGITNNTAGLGARVRVVAGSLKQIRDIESSGGGINNGHIWAHFGLGSATTVDSVIVQWPTGVVDVITNVAADKYYTCVEGQDKLTGITDKSGKNPIPTGYTLLQNFPNPFNPTTTIQYTIPKVSQVTLTIYNINGQVIRRLVNQKQEPGFYTVMWDASSMPSGIYFYKIQAGDFQKVNKCLLIK